MSAAIAPETVLQRVLELERQKNFQNQAATIDLDVFAQRQAERAGNQPALQSAVRKLAGYANASRAEREQAVADALRALEQVRDMDVQNLGPEPLGVPSTNRNGPAARAGSTGLPSSDVPRAPDMGKPDSQALDSLRVPSSVHSSLDLEREVTKLKGMRKSWIDPLARSGVHSIRDLLQYYPRAHYDYSDTSSISRMRMGQKTTLVGTIEDVRNNRTRRGIVITTATITDSTGMVAVRWFNQPYMRKNLPIGRRLAVSGEPELYNGFVTFQPREYEVIEEEDLTHTGRLVPVYPLTKGLFQRSLRRLIRSALEEYAGAVEDYLPDRLVSQLGLLPLTSAIAQFHFPESERTKEWAQRRLAFDELLMIQLGLLMRKRKWQQRLPEVAVPVNHDLLEQFEASLPFQLTIAQKRVTKEVMSDLRQETPMSRLLEGDVGSGKTVVAASALLQVVRAGQQAVLMAPTEILAEQHFRTLQALLTPFGVQCELLIGSTARPERSRIYEEVADGSVQVVVGTHALIQEGLEFMRLRLAITDEQHRFGVEQRATLRQKGFHPHILAMTATPIPRTLAMTIYGDLDVSLLDEMPPGRKPAQTTWSRIASEAYSRVRDELQAGRQAFVICPVIEESMESDMRSVIAEHRELEKRFAGFRVGLLHGRMKAAEKDTILSAFRGGSYHILVATSVVEVGIDVPNATVMVIRDAHRFGLAQLHQFRGRVGRGGDQPYCILLSDARTDDARERLLALTATENGFELAEEDLRLRGPGEFWGTRQSGLPELKVARLGDIATIELSRRAAHQLLDGDPALAGKENQPLKQQVERFWSEKADFS